jgi:cytochrome P450
VYYKIASQDPSLLFIKSRYLTSLGFSIAGSDTTATAVRATFLYIITIPRVHHKLLTEISSATLSSPISDAEAKKLPYLQAVIKEGLRIYPPVAGLMAKKVPPGGDTINGMFVPGGTQIGYGAWGIFRNKKIWGDDADAFLPERWLEGENIREQELALELIFAAGRYQCLGKSVALMELNKVFVEVCPPCTCLSRSSLVA